MADRKISEAGTPTLTSLASGDFVPVLDVSNTSDGAGGTNSKITRDNLSNDIASDLPVLEAGLRTTVDTGTPDLISIDVDLSIGLAGGTTLTGGLNAGDDLTLSSTSNATKGYIVMGTSIYDEVNNRLGIGMTPTVPLDVTGAIKGSTTASITTSVTTPEIIGGTASGDDITISSTSDSTRGTIFLRDQIQLVSENKTNSGSTVYALLSVLGATTTITMDGSANNTLRAFNLAPLVVFDANSGAAFSGQFIHFQATVSNTNGTPYTIAPWSVFSHLGVFNADNATQTFGGFLGARLYSNYGVANGGTLTVTNDIGVENGLVINTGATVTTHYGFRVIDPTGAGTLTNQIGLDVAALTKGGTSNIGIRIAKADTYSLQLSSTAGDAASGITFGTDANLYRSAADFLKTDDSLIVVGRHEESQGADVASANNMVLGSDGNTFEITGTTQINLISNLTWQNGSVVNLLFTSNPTVKHAQTTSTTDITILLAGAADFVASAGDVLSLVLSEIGGTQAWRETGRSVI